MITAVIASAHFRQDSDTAPAATAAAKRWARARRLGCQKLIFLCFDGDLF